MAEVDPKLLEMAEVFHIPFREKMKYIILPAKFPGKAGKDSGDKVQNGKRSGGSDR